MVRRVVTVPFSGNNEVRSDMEFWGEFSRAVDAQPRDWLALRTLRTSLRTTSNTSCLDNTIGHCRALGALQQSSDDMSSSVWPFYLLIPTCILIHLFVSPYTKVEESFNIQAIHDILIHGIPSKNADQFLTANYDHVSFPGSVPRTFAGALLLSGLSRPWVRLASSTAQLQLLGKQPMTFLMPNGD